MNKKTLKIGLYFLLILIAVLALNHIVNAQYSIPSDFKPELAPDIQKSPTSGKTEYTTSTISMFIQFLASNLIYFAGALTIFFIVWGGFTYVTAMGKQEKMEEAKKTITWAIVGLLAVMFSYAIVQYILRLFMELPS